MEKLNTPLYNNILLINIFQQNNHITEHFNMTCLNDFKNGLNITLFNKKNNKSYDGEVVKIDVIKNKVQVKIGDKLVLTPIKYLTIKEQEKSIQDCFLLNMLCDDIMDMVLNHKKYMDRNYILKMLSKDDIKYCMSGPLNENSMRITYFDVATKPKLMGMVDRHFIKSKKLNPNGLSKNMYYSDLFKEKVIEIEDKKKVKKTQQLNHKFQVGDILFKNNNREYSSSNVFYKVLKLTPKSYRLVALCDFTRDEDRESGWLREMVYIDIDDPTETSYEVSNVKEKDFKLLSEYMEESSFLFKRYTDRNINYVGYNFSTIDLWR